jgi:succinate dehydrogenase cytochrome b556 subunit
MRYLTDRKRANGMGSAKSGTAHFWAMKVSSVALLILIPLFVFTFGTIVGEDYATVTEYFAMADAVMTSWFGKLVMLGSIWALWYHTLGGVRHLIWDNAIALDIPTAEKLGWAVVVGSFVLTAITVAVL